MTDLSHTIVFRAHWTEKRPQPVGLTDTERLDWFGEHCDKYEYVKPAPTGIGHHVIICGGAKTTAANFRDAIDEAAGKFKEES